MIQIGSFSLPKHCLIIAEVGINHNGDINLAFKMIEAAKKAGADAVKFQTFKAAEFVADRSQKFTYQSQGKQITESMYDMFKRYELQDEDWIKIKQKCDQENILFLSTPQNESDLEVLLKLNIPAIKVGSDDFTNLPLLKKYKSTQLPMILSCGMANLTEVCRSLEEAGVYEEYPLILLVCTSEYPTPPEHANLNRLKTLRAIFPNLILGFSDHTQGVAAVSIAVALGAKVFEKHFTLSKDFPGPDHWFSETPETLCDWVHTIRESLLLLGDGEIKPSLVELQNKKEFRRVMVAKKRISVGDSFSFENISFKRVAGGKGLIPAYLELILDKKSSQNYQPNEIIEL